MVWHRRHTLETFSAVDGVSLLAEAELPVRPHGHMDPLKLPDRLARASASTRLDWLSERLNCQSVRKPKLNAEHFTGPEICSR
jgi:hypothetical protein